MQKLKAEFKNTKPPSGSSSKVLTGARAIVKINGKEVDAFVEDMRVSFEKAMRDAVVFRTPIIHEPIEVIVTLKHDGTGWRVVDDSSDEVAKWQDSWARLSPEEIEACECWERAAE